MSFTPEGEIRLIINHPFDNTYENTIDFEDEEEQLEYFIARTSTLLPPANFKPAENIIKLPIHLENMWECNYLMYKSKLTGKWIFCFITDKKYINEGNTEVQIEIDVMQTYMFDYSLESSFIEREHQDRWSGIGIPIYNTVPEGLSYGDEYLKVNESIVAESEKCFLIVSSKCLHGVDADNSPVIIQQSPTPFYFYVVPWSTGTMVLDRVTLCDAMSKNPDIVSVSLIPFLPFSIASCLEVFYVHPSVGSTGIKLFWIQDSKASLRNLNTVNKFESVPLPSSFGTGIPRDIKYESKLLTYPYRYNMLSDFQSTPLVLKNEFIEGNSPHIVCLTSLSHQLKTKYYLNTGYAGDTTGKLHCLVNNTINELPLVSSAYLNYILTSKASATTGMALSVAGSLATLGVGMATGGATLGLGVGAALSSVGTVAQNMAKEKEIQNIPSSVRTYGNNLAFDIEDNNTSLKFIRFSITPEYQQILGDYFAKYGYKCMRVKKPNLRSRYYYNFIKTIGANISGNFDNKELSKVKEIYDKGITIWHNRAGVTPYNFSYDNVEISLT